MKYKLLQIRPSAGKPGTLDVSITEDGMDRVKGRSCTPNAMGFFHYWETIPDEEAFERLKICMMEVYLKQLKGVQNAIYALCDLQLPKGSRKGNRGRQVERRKPRRAKSSVSNRRTGSSV